MSGLSAWAPVSICFGLAFGLTALVRHYAMRRGLLDQPGPRRSHQQATPRGGGVAPVIAFVLVATSLTFLGRLPLQPTMTICAAVAAMALLGWLDDHRDLSARFRFAIQALVSAAALFSLDGLDPGFTGQAGLPMFLLVQLLAWLGLIWLTNLFNFMDGINGLASLETVFAALVMWWLSGSDPFSMVALLFAVAILGFVPWNAPRARIFLGDAGSASLGMGIGLLGLAAANHNLLSPWSTGILLSLFLVDATATLLWRFIKGDQWYTPHREHAYQRLARRGWSHMKITGLYMAINLLFIVPVLVFIERAAWPELPIMVTVLLLLLGLWWTTRIMTVRETTR